MEITFLQGRTDDQKRALYRCVVDEAAAAGYRPDDIMIALTENAPIDWALCQGLAFKGHSYPKASFYRRRRLLNR